MSLILQNPLSNSNHRIKFYSPNNIPHFNSSKTLNFYHQSFPNHTYPLHKNFIFLRNRLSIVKAHDSSFTAFQQQETSTAKLFTFDAFLNFLESICVVSSVLISAGFLVNWSFLKQHSHVLLLLGNRLLIWLLAGAVAVGSVIRRRQWSRVCGSPTMSRPGSESGNVIERIEMLEESMKNATSIIRMLSRQLEKLGIRFRVTRKALKDPITEAATLAQKNSEATRALAVQEGILEKELAEVQKVLLAMQDQQQKQLELILAIAKSGKLLETKQAPSKGPDTNETDSDYGVRHVDGQQIKAMVAQKGIDQ